jgi:hypothetical protein
MDRELGQVAIDLTMVAQRETNTGQFGALAAARIDEVESGFACHVSVSAT